MKTITRMKQMVLAIALASPQVMMAGDINISASFPDPNVQAVLATYDTSGDGILQESEQTFTTLSLGYMGVTDLTGIKLLTQLETLLVHSNPGLTTIDISGLTKLTSLYADDCANLTTIKADGCSSLSWISNYYDSDYPALKTLSLKGTAFSSFSVAGGNIESVDLSNCTQLTSVSATYKDNLTSLKIDGCTELTSLTVTNNASLVNLTVKDLTKLKSLDISDSPVLDNPTLKGLTALTSLDAHNTPGMKTLDVSEMPALESIYLQETGLSTLDISGLTKVTSLYAHDCANLTTIKADGCSSLSWISNYYDSSYPALKTLSLKGTAFTSFSIRGENLESVDLSNCTQLTSVTANGYDKLTSLKIDGCTELTSLKVTNNASLVNLTVKDLEKLTSLDISDSPALDNPTLKGLTALTSFDAHNTLGMKTLDVSEMPALENVYLYETGLSTLDISGLTKVTSLYAHDCANLTTIKADGCSSLSWISNFYDSNYPALKTLSLKGTAFTSFGVRGANIESVDLSNCTQLTSVSAQGYDKLTSLKIDGCTELTSLKVTGNASLVNLSVVGLEKLTSLDISDSPALDNPTLKGLTALTSFDAHNTPGMKTLDVSEMPALEYVYLYETGLSTIDISGLTKVTALYAHDCANLTTIIADGCSSLSWISNYYDSNYSALKTLSLKGTAFTSFGVRGENIESVDLSNCTQLTSVTADGYEKLTSLNVDGCTALTSLTISNDPLISSYDIDDSKLPALTSFTITNLPLLETLTVKSATLTSLDCSQNTLRTLDVTQCPELTYLNCTYNQLTSLDLSKNTKLSSAYTDQHNIDTDMVFLSATQVGFVINDGFNATNVVEFRIDSDVMEPAYATLDGVKYLLVYNNAADAEEYLKDKTIRYGYDTGLPGFPLNNKINITGYTKAPSFLKVSPEVVNGVYGGTVAAPTLTRSEGYNGAVSYKSANEKVVKVAADGKLTIIGAGETTVTVSGEEIEYRLAPADVTYSVKIAKASPVFTFANATQEMIIQDAVPANALNKGVYDGTVTYSSSDESVATIAADGKVTVKKAGTVTFTASGAATSNCNAPTAASYKLTIKKRTTTLAVASATVEGVYGGTVTAPAVTLNGYNGTLTYASSNEGVVTVAADGKLTVKGAGEATITVSGAETAIYYAPAAITYKVKIAKASPTIAFAQSVVVIEKGIDEATFENSLNVGIYDGTITYSSSDPSFATVDANGKVTFLQIAKKTVTITANGAATANCNAVKASYQITMNVTTGIDGMAMIPNDGHYYTPAGVLVVKPVKGRLYIRNGKKVVYKGKE